MTREPNVVYAAGSDMPYCRVEPMPDPIKHFDPSRPSFGNGVKVQPLDVGGHPQGPPMLFTSQGAHQLEQLLHWARAESKPVRT